MSTVRSPCSAAISSISVASPCTNSAPSSTGTASEFVCTVRMRPPMRSRASRMRQGTPASSSARAAARPAAPAPMMTTGLPEPRRDCLSCLALRFTELIGMIGRIWHGWAAREDADAYEAMLNSDVLPGPDQIPGYRGAYVMRREVGDEVEFVTITVFDDIAAVKQFAGEDYTKAVVKGPAKKLLKRSDDRSTHYEVVRSPGKQSRG